jgi:hypothetical protein
MNNYCELKLLNKNQTSLKCSHNSFLKIHPIINLIFTFKFPSILVYLAIFIKELYSNSIDSLTFICDYPALFFSSKDIYPSPYLFFSLLFFRLTFSLFVFCEASSSNVPDRWMCSQAFCSITFIFFHIHDISLTKYIY